MFYGFYISKIILQKKQSIKTNQMGTGNKPKKVLLIERIMSVATVSTVIVDVCRIFIVKKYPIVQIRIVGLLIGSLSVIVFAFVSVLSRPKINEFNNFRSQYPS